MHLGLVLLHLCTSCVAAGSPFTDSFGKPFIPFGFYQYTVDKPLDAALPGAEALHGMTLTSPYASTAAPTQQWWDDMTSFLDRCAAVGVSVNYQLIAFETLDNSDETLANLTAQIEAFKGHSAIISWYLADEPGGQGIAPETLKPKYDAVKKASAVQQEWTLLTRPL